MGTDLAFYVEKVAACLSPVWGCGFFIQVDIVNGNDTWVRFGHKIVAARGISAE